MKLIRFIIASFILLQFVSCGSFNKLLKSTDINAKYNEAIRLYHHKKYTRAIALFDNIQPNVQGTTKEDTLLFYFGKSHYNTKDYSIASEVFNIYRDRFTRTAYTEEAEYLYAMCFYFLSLPAEKDQTQTKQAIIAFNEYLNRYPASIQAQYIHDLIDELTNKLYYKTYLNAALYHKLDHYNAAITALKSAIKQYPEIPYREEMMYLICKSWFDYAQGSVFSRQLDRYMKMTDAYYNFLTAYPESKQFRKELDKMFEVATQFTKEYGAQSKEAEQSISSIEQRKVNIAEAKDKLFSVENKAERTKLKETIRTEREAIKKQKESLKRQKKNYKLEKKLMEQPKTKTKTKQQEKAIDKIE